MVRRGDGASYVGYHDCKIALLPEPALWQVPVNVALNCARNENLIARGVITPTQRSQRPRARQRDVAQKHPDKHADARCPTLTLSGSEGCGTARGLTRQHGMSWHARPTLHVIISVMKCEEPNETRKDCSDNMAKGAPHRAASSRFDAHPPPLKTRFRGGPHEAWTETEPTEE